MKGTVKQFFKDYIRLDVLDEIVDKNSLNMMRLYSCYSWWLIIWSSKGFRSVVTIDLSNIFNYPSLPKGKPIAYW